MIKLRITITAVFEYEADPKNYPNCTTPAEMLAVDLDNAEEDPFSFLATDSVEWKTTGEVIE